MYPLQAYIISKNIQPAFIMSNNKMGAAGELNGKKDAFRHAYFNAINTRDVTPRVYPTYMSASEIVLLFSVAHESEVPTQLLLERDMDLYNNQIGINYCWNCFPGISSDNNIADAILTKLNNGELKYLTPLNFIVSPLYDENQDKIQDCPTCLNGIINTTNLKWTNQ